MNKNIFLGLVLMLITSISYGKVFVPQNGSFIEKTINIENKSIRNVVKYLGYNSDQFYTYSNSDAGDTGILLVVFKIFTNQIICIITDESVEKLSAERMEKYLLKFDLKKEFDSYTIESKLNEGIKNKSLTSDFLAKVLNLENPEPNGTLYASSIGYNLEFRQGIIVKFYSSDGLNKWAKQWKVENYELYKSYEDAAKKYWGDRC